MVHLTPGRQSRRRKTPRVPGYEHGVRRSVGRAQSKLRPTMASASHRCCERVGDKHMPWRLLIDIARRSTGRTCFGKLVHDMHRCGDGSNVLWRLDACTPVDTTAATRHWTASPTWGDGQGRKATFGQGKASTRCLRLRRGCPHVTHSHLPRKTRHTSGANPTGRRADGHGTGGRPHIASSSPRRCARRRRGVGIAKHARMPGDLHRTYPREAFST